MIHNYGAKADRDRAMLLSSYDEMCRVFKTPKDERMTPFEISKLNNTELSRAANALYIRAPDRKKRIMAERLGMTVPVKDTIFHKIKVAIYGVLIDIRMARKKIPRGEGVKNDQG